MWLRGFSLTYSPGLPQGQAWLEKGSATGKEASFAYASFKLFLIWNRPSFSALQRKPSCLYFAPSPPPHCFGLFFNFIFFLPKPPVLYSLHPGYCCHPSIS